MGDSYKVQRKSGAVWRTVGRPRKGVAEAYDQYLAALRNAPSGQTLRIQQGKRTIREEVAK